MIAVVLRMFYVFFRIGLVSVGGGYAMLSFIISQALSLGISPLQIADLMALDLLIPGPVAINAATYTGWIYGSLHGGGLTSFLGSVSATLGVSAPSLILVPVFMYFMTKLTDSRIFNGFLYGAKLAAVGLVAAAAVVIAQTVLLVPGQSYEEVFSDPFTVLCPVCIAIFLATAFLNIKYKTNPILLTLTAGVLGAIFLR